MRLIKFISECIRHGCWAVAGKLYVVLHTILWRVYGGNAFPLLSEIYNRL